MKSCFTRRKFLKAAGGVAAWGTLSACTFLPKNPCAKQDVKATAEQTAYLEVFDWGPGVTRSILTLDRAVTPESVKADFFSVKESKPSINFMTGEIFAVECERTVLDAYCCDETGQKTEAASSQIALEMACTPQEGYPVFADMSWQSRLTEDYALTVTLADESELKSSDGASIVALSISERIDWQDALIPELDTIGLEGSFTSSEGRTYRYASYEPAKDQKKHPLVVWLHGAGEGGTDIRMPVIGNRAVALCQKEFQAVMGGAYVLIPQCPDFWLTYNENGDWQGNPGKDSVHLKSIEELIRNYAEQHEEIDAGRIYLAGCSNGGFMVMDLILNYPDEYAAAVPCCEAFLDEAITDEKLEKVKDLPIWFVFAGTDPVVVPENYERPTIERLKKIGASNVHVSEFEKIVDLSGRYTAADGTPYDYGGHSCWVHFFNNDCADEENNNCWEWLADQRKS